MDKTTDRKTKRTFTDDPKWELDPSISAMFLASITKLCSLVCETELAFISKRKRGKRIILARYGDNDKEIPEANVELFFSSILSSKVLEINDLSQGSPRQDVISQIKDYRFYAAAAFAYDHGIITLEVFGKKSKLLHLEQKKQLVESISLVEQEIHKTDYILELENKYNHYEKLFLQNLDILVIINKNGTINKVNQQWYEILKFSEEETLGTVFLDFIHPGDYACTLPVIKHIFRQKKVKDFKIRFKNKNGEYRILQWRAYSNGQQIFASARDITEKQKKESEIQRLTNLLTDAQEIGSLGAWELELETGKVTWTEEVYKIHELDNKVIDSLANAIDFYHPEDRQIMARALDITAKTGEPFDVTCRLITANKNLRWVKSLGRLMKGHDQSARIVGIFQDVTQKTIEDQGKEYQSLLLKGLFTRSPIGIGLVDLSSGMFLEVNQKLIDPTGYSMKEFENLHLWDLMLPEDAAEHKYILKNINSYQNYGPKELLYIKKDKSSYPVVISGVVLIDGYGKQKFWTFIEDISQRKQYENQISESLSRLQGIMDASTQVCIISIDNTGIIQNFNRGAELLLGYAALDVINLSSIEILSPREVYHRTKNRLNHQDQALKHLENESLLNSIKKQNILQSGEWTLQKENGVNVPVDLIITPIKQGEFTTGYLLIANDITPIKKANEELQFLLDLSKNQNERLTNFANIVSHNLKSHSGNIDTLIQFLLDDQPLLKEQELVKMIQLASENLKETITHLSEVALVNVNENQQHEQIFLFETANKAIDSILAIAIKESVQIINEIEKHSFVMGIPAYLDSIILNFLTNGIKYRSKDRKCYIRLLLHEENDYKVLHVEDNGLGIDLHKYGSKLFGLYKTFHSKTDSQGIGLFITKNQVESMGGFIHVESEVNKGTTFKIYFKDQKPT